MTIFIRPAFVSDIPAIILLNREIQQLHADLEPTFFKAVTNDEEIEAFFKARLKSAEHAILLAEIESEPVGYAWFEIQDRPETPFALSRKRIYIHHLSVKKTARRTGIGTALLAHIQTQALTAGIENIILDTWAANGAARGFFEAKGFSPFNLVFGKHVR